MSYNQFLDGVEIMFVRTVSTAPHHSSWLCMLPLSFVLMYFFKSKSSEALSPLQIVIAFKNSWETVLVYIYFGLGCKRRGKFSQKKCFSNYLFFLVRIGLWIINNIEADYY